MLTCQKHLFDLDPEVHYINGAYMSPLMLSVAEAGYKGIRKKVQPYNLSIADFFEDVEQLRGVFAQVVNVTNPERIAIIPSVSYGMAIVTENIKVRAGQNIVVAEAQFPSNVYPWRKLAEERGLHIKTVAYPTQKEGRGAAWNTRILEAIDAETAVVALAHTHWANGTKFDVARIGKRAREVEAYFVIDGTQSVGAMPFDVAAIQPDALICGGYKWLMGPYQLGYAYFNEKFDNGKPLEEGWITRRDSENFADLVNYKDEYQPYALRYDVGERSNFVTIPMGIAALQQLLAWGIADIQAYCRRLTEGVIPAWQARGYWVEEADWRGHHLFGVQMPPDVSVEKLQTRLKAQRISVSVRGDFMRISPNVYNDEKDIEVLTEVLLGF